MKLVFRSVGDAGQLFPAWLRALDGASGVYVIRDADTKDVLYVGESHTGRLSRTMVRHLQQWRRDKAFWSGAGFSRNDPGTRYRRADVEVAAFKVPASRAVAVQDSLIVELDPRDNVQGVDQQARAEKRRARRRRRVVASMLPDLPF